MGLNDKNKKSHKRHIRLIFTSFLFLFFIPVISSCSKNARTENPVISGVLNLNRPENSEQIVRLDGEWKFVYGSFLTPADPAWKDARFVKVPDVWRNYSADGGKLPDQGICTMQMTIEGLEPGERIGVKLYVVESAYVLFADGDIIIRSGKTGLNRKSEQPSYKPQIAWINPDKQSVTLTIQISNYHDRFGGMWMSALVGPEKKISVKNYLDMAFEMVVLGVLLVLAVYYFIVWLMAKDRVASLFFGLGCLMLWLRTMTAGEIFFMIVFPAFSFELNYKLQFASQAAAALLLFMCVRRIYPQVFHSIAERVMQIAMIVYMLFIFSFPLYVYSRVLSWFHVFLIIASVYFFIALIRGIAARLPGTRMLGSGALLFVVTIVNDILYSNALIETGYFVTWGLGVFSVSFIIVLEMQNRSGAKLKSLVPDFADFEKQNISKREFDVLELLVKGLSYYQIADRLFISHSTVTKHVHSIYGKLGVKNRVGLYDAIAEIEK